MKKRAKVHLLPTDKADKGCIIKYNDIPNYMIYNTTYQTQEWLKQENNRSSHNLYFITDDEIKEGDWCLFFWDGNTKDELGKVGSEPQQYLPSEGHTLNRNLRKIIATTDPKLHSTRLKDCPINPEDNMVSVRGVSKPPKSFIEEYCKAGGIDEVDVEYGLFHDGNFKDDDETHAFKAIRKPKVNSHNEITIHPVKNSWTVEDLPDLLNRFCKDHSLHRGLQITDGMIREWLEKQ